VRQRLEARRHEQLHRCATSDPRLGDSGPTHRVSAAAAQRVERYGPPSGALPAIVTVVGAEIPIPVVEQAVVIGAIGLIEPEVVDVEPVEVGVVA
jgi:hypothetical protein